MPGPVNWDPIVLEQHDAFLLVGIGTGNHGTHGGVRRVGGLVGDTGGDVDKVARMHAHHMLQPRPVAHLGYAFEHEDRGLVRFVIVRSCADARRNLEQMHTDSPGARTLCRDAGGVEGELVVPGR